MVTFGKFHTEFGKVQIKDFFSFLIWDIPVFVVRKFFFLDTEEVSWVVAFCGIKITVVK